MSDIRRPSREQFAELRQRDRSKGGRKGRSASPPAPTADQTASLEPKRSRTFFQLFARFWDLIRGHRRTLLLALATSSASTLLGLLPLYGTKLVFDNVLAGHPLPPKLEDWVRLPTDRRSLLAAVAILMVVISVVALALGTWGRWHMTRLSQRVAVTVRRRLFEHAVRLPLHRIYDLKSGGIASVLREDAGGIGQLIFSMIYNPWRAIIQLAGSLFVLAFVDWRMLLGSLVVLPTVWLTHRTWIARIRPLFKQIRQTRQGIDAQATESFGGIRIVRAFGRQRWEAGQFTRRNHLMARQEVHAWWWMRGVDAAWAILIPLATAILLWYGGSRVLGDAERVQAGTLEFSQALTVGDLVMFIAYLTALLEPIATLAQSATGLQNSLAGLDRTIELLAEPREMPVPEHAVFVDRHTVIGHLNLEGVSFTYPRSQTEVLTDIHLEVEPGTTVALVGPSGAGKTTLCNLVCRFYDPTQGRILLDGVDLRQIEVDSYRCLFGIVEQDTFLFDGTIAENIAYGRRDVSRESVLAAAEQANAHEFIARFEKGYDTLIGERGVKLSGGQRQRLSIARAILADPTFLILDEATSNLDSDSERLIQDALRLLMADRTSFVIAHRLSTIAWADLIVVLDQGRIIERGTHAQLMARSGRYRHMVEQQTHPIQERVSDMESPVR